MKKILFATTALVATTGMAAAEVTFGGFGRFGLYYQESDTPDASETRIEQRFRLTATGVATSDNGLKFEGRIRWQTDEGSSEDLTDPTEGANTFGSSNVAQRSAAGFAVTAGGFRLDIGHVSDVIDSGDVVDYYGYGVGLTSFAEQSSGFQLPVSGFGVSGDDDRIPPTIKLRYTAGDLTVSASYTDDSPVGDGTNVIERAEYQIGVGYNFGNYSVGVAFGNEEADVDGVSDPTRDNDFWAATFSGDIGAFAFSVLVADSDGQDDTSYGFSVKYDVSAVTDIRFVYSDNGVDADDEVVAIGFQHGLGGGVSLRGGIGQNTSGNTVADLGVVFNF